MANQGTIRRRGGAITLNEGPAGNTSLDEVVGGVLNFDPSEGVDPQSGMPYEVWAIEDYRTGFAGNVVIWNNIKQELYEYMPPPTTVPTSEIEHWVIPVTGRAAPGTVPGFHQVPNAGFAYATLAEARYIALQKQMGGAFQARIRDGMPLAWISFTQVFYVLVLFSPGVIFVGSMYAAVAQVAVVISASMSNAPYLMTATRVSTAVAIGNVLLSLLVWQAASSTMDKIGAAYRAALVTVIGSAMACTNEYLSRVADTHRQKSLSYPAAQ